MFYRSERLFLRPAWPEDRAAIFAGIADEAIVRNLAQVPWSYTIEDARALFHDHSANGRRGAADRLRRAACPCRRG